MSNGPEHTPMYCPSCGSILQGGHGTALRCENCTPKEHSGGSRPTPPVGKPSPGDLSDLPNPALRLTAPEHAALTSIPAHRLQCTKCGMESETPNLSDHCPYCADPITVELDDTGLIAPASVIPFTVGPDDVDRCFREWAGSEPLAKSDFKKGVEAGARQSVYLPYWIVKTHLYSNYRGKRGDYNDVTHYHPKHGHQRKRETLWSPAEGQVVHPPHEHHEPAFDPEAVIGGVAGNTVKTIQKEWDFTRAVPFDRDMLAGHRALRYGTEPETAVAHARESQKQQVHKDINAHMGGDNQDISWTDTGDVTLECRLVLVPVWIVDWSFAGKNGRVLINGQTGKGAGKSITSAKKTTALIAGIVGVVVLCCGGVAVIGSQAEDTDGVRGTKEVTKAAYGLQDKDWPFEADEAVLTCHTGRSLTATIDGQVYFLEPVKDDDLERAQDEGWENAETILIDDEDLFSTTSLWDLRSEAKEACRR